MKQLFNILVLMLLCINGYAQKHLTPVNGGDGIPGPISRSFIITWASNDSVATYQYIVSDNPLCFYGCPGDTRQGYTEDTTVTEFNLQEGKWYYWVTRVYYLNGEVSNWSIRISSFLAKTPPEKPEDKFVEIAPNPVIGNNIHLKVDWWVNPDADYFSVAVYDLHGHIICDSLKFYSGGGRFEGFDIDLSNKNINKKVAIIVITVGDNPNNPNNIIDKKIIFQ